ncbi:MAG TPA: lipopolysaccharide biosynthesis protein [Allosphingosinicella sp.]|jgi:O-antigen/teichoic acid export membrane protein
MIREFLGKSIFFGVITVISRSAAVISLLVLPYILDPSAYGALAMISLTSMFVLAMVPLQITQGLARYYSTGPAGERERYVATAWLFTLLQYGLFLAISMPLTGPISELLFAGSGSEIRSYQMAMPTALLAIVSNGLFFFVQTQLRWSMRTGGFAAVSIIYSFLTLGLSVGLGAAADHPFRGVITGQLLAALIATAIGIWLLRKSLATRFDRKKFQEMALFSLPLVPGSLFVFIIGSASRIALNGVGTLADVGVYTFANQIAGLATLSIVGIQGALAPLVMANFDKPETPATLGSFFEGFTAFAACLCLGLGLFSNDLIRLIGSPGYAEASELVLLLAPALIIAEMYIFSPGFFIAKRTTRQMWVSAVGAAVSLGLAYPLSAAWGVHGAAVAALLGSIAFFMSWFLAAQPLYPVPVRWGRVGIFCAVAIGLGFAGVHVRFESVLPSLAFKAALVVAALVAAVGSGLFPAARIYAAARRRRAASARRDLGH